MTEAPRVTVAIPVYNEQDVLPELFRRVVAVLDALPGGPHQVVLVNDGSTDRTREVLDQAAASDPRLRVVHLARNFGHQVALTAALDHAQGDVVVLMDADLQDEPELIPRFLEKYREGFDVVYGVRAHRDASLFLRFCYRAFYRLMSLIAAQPIPRDAGDFSLLSRRAVDALRATPERGRYLRGLRAWVGFRQVGIPVDRPERAAGKSKYSLRRLIGLGLDGLFAFSIIPLRLAALTGFVGLLASAGYAAYAIGVKLFLDRAPTGFTALVVLMVFLFGVNFLFLGIVGEYIARIYEEVKRRPHYVIDRVVESEGDGA